jgi:hypothetical protein
MALSILWFLPEYLLGSSEIKEVALFNLNLISACFIHWTMGWFYLNVSEQVPFILDVRLYTDSDAISNEIEKTGKRVAFLHWLSTALSLVSAFAVLLIYFPDKDRQECLSNGQGVYTLYFMLVYANTLSIAIFATLGAIVKISQFIKATKNMFPNRALIILHLAFLTFMLMAMLLLSTYAYSVCLNTEFA